MSLATTHVDIVDTHQARGTTTAGEHCILVALNARRRGGDMIERRVGIVYADRYMTIVDGSFVMGDAAVTFRAFIDSLTRQLPLRDGGRVRFRRYVHRVPSGWAVRTRDMTTHLFAPDGLTVMTVLPAEPISADDVVKKFLYEDMVVHFKPDDDIRARKHTTPNGLSGDIVWAHGTGAARDKPIAIGTALLRDDAFLYVARYERPDPRHPAYEAELTRLIDSIEPVPRPSESSPRLDSSYWLG